MAVWSCPVGLLYMQTAEHVNVGNLSERGEKMPREKTMKVVFAFPTTTMAMKMEAAAKEKEAPGRLIPVPRQISAGCGMAWCAPIADRVSLEQLIDEEQIVTEGCYELLL